MERATGTRAGVVFLIVLGAGLLVDAYLLLENAERPTPRILRLGLEWMAPAIAQYVKLGLAAVAMAAAYRARRLPVYASWTAAFLILLVDDSLQGHERVARPLLQALGLQGSAVTAAREALALLGVGLLVVAIVLWGYRATHDPAARRYSREALALLVVLAFFAVGMDALHTIIGRGIRLLGLVEDGGQLVVLSVVLAHAVAHLSAARSPAGPGLDLRGVLGRRGPDAPPPAEHRGEDAGEQDRDVGQERPGPALVVGSSRPADRAP